VKGENMSETPDEPVKEPETEKPPVEEAKEPETKEAEKAPEDTKSA
jgi:hypothetical protein